MDGRLQRDYITKDETASPTVAIEALFLTCLIDTLEERDVAICDIPGAFMHPDLNDDEVIHVKLEGIMGEIMMKINQKLYTKYVVQERVKPVLYMRLKKVLYGTVQAAFLFWENISSKL